MVSCIITTYKRPIKIVKRALESVINQTYEDMEILLVNDDPEDKKRDEELRLLIQSFPKNIQYILLPAHLGACQARNIGVEKAEGEYIAFLDDDDEWLPEKLEKQMECIKEGDVALVYSSHYYVNLKGRRREIEEPLAGVRKNRQELKYLLRENFIGSTSSPLIKKQAIKAVGGFDKNLKSSQDHDLWLRIAREFDICYQREPLVILHYSKDAISRSKKRILQGYECLLKKYVCFYEKDKSTYNYRLNYLAYCCISHGYGREALQYWIRAIKVKWFSIYNFMILGRIWRKIRYVLGNGD